MRAHSLIGWLFALVVATSPTPAPPTPPFYPNYPQLGSAGDPYPERNPFAPRWDP